MSTGIRRFGTAVLTAALVTGLTATTATAAPERTELRQAMNELVTAGGAGVQVRVHDGQGNWAGSAGTRELGGHAKVPTDGRYRVGSITKTFVSTVILQLVGEGKVELDKPVDQYLPRFGLDRRITVRMILQHTSGLFNYTGEVNPDGSLDPGIPLDGQEFIDKRFHTYQPEELVGVALAKPPRFEPGTSWSYSNTNYVLAGLLVEQLTGTDYTEQLSRRILHPLGLRDTSFPGTRPGIPGPHAHGYYAYSVEGERKLVDITKLNPSWATSAGEIISTTKDLDRFITGLLGGKLLSPPLLAEMLKMAPAGELGAYGLGVQKMETGCGEPVYGHTGGIHGYQSFLFSTLDGTNRLEISLTQGDVDTSDPAAAEKYYRAAEKVAVVAACGKTPPVAQRQLVDLR
ncbi:serine hydrolase domain-containing protein [Amycolatopsis nigrescens]|uniref:serine hydrolase domain-containing protein n=1 Tax=Amycolatopsis nigrescens TaxID=381445 RepID=UPI0003AB14F1|nr:serine hydrolase domain-containing protein [Amycolatopsis nigrescens]